MLANPTAPPAEKAASDKAVPDWFARGRIARSVKAQFDPPHSEVRRKPTPSGFRRALWGIAGGGAVGYGISLVAHSLILVACSLVVLHFGKGTGGGTVNTRLGVPGATGDEFLDTRSFEIMNGSEGLEEPVTVVESVPLDLPTADLGLATAIDPKTPGAPDGSGQDDKSVEGSGIGDDGAFELPSGGTAVQQGSFAAWTVPADPRVGQDYVIVIEVTLPPGTERYTKADLSGNLIGTDGYKVAIPNGREWNGKGWTAPLRVPAFRRNGDKARVVFFIRGAHQHLVRDTIHVRSRLLDEQQRLMITF